MSKDADPGGASDAAAGFAVLGTLISGMAVWGGVGWLLDRWLDTRAFLPIGVLLGVTCSIYIIVVKYAK
jgi:F0F1-type ATP synthase assembly protein I